jgi:putative oxidoreductase
VESLGLLFVRLGFGITLAFAHGLGKVPPSDQLIAGVEKLGFPVPFLFAWAAALSELVGGILLAAGLFVRPAAFFVAFTMGVAAFRVHAADAFNVKEMALLYFTVAVALLAAGGGNYSIDWLLFRKR